VTHCLLGELNRSTREHSRQGISIESR